MVFREPRLRLLSEYGTRCAVWGDPISHSRSPLLHRAAYEELGLNWTYERRRVDASGFPTAIAELDASWRGLSLTMPLKAEALAWGTGAADPVALATAAANTAVLNGPGQLRAWNTDVYGLQKALTEADFLPASGATVRVLGSGATATSAIAALQGSPERGTFAVQLFSRRPSNILGVQSRPLEAEVIRSLPPADFTISTLPGGAALAPELAQALAASSVALFDVAYDPWPSQLARAWHDLGRRAVSGEGMLLHQAVAQIRIWLTGDATEPLPNEARVVDRMREALRGA